MTDTEFDFRVELILKNDKNGLREIYQCYGKVIYNIMLDIVKSPQDAEDLTSDFFLKLWDTAGQYRKGTGHKRYLTVMAKNLALDFIRKRRHEMPTLDDDEVGHKEQQDSMRVDDDVEKASHRMTGIHFQKDSILIQPILIRDIHMREIRDMVRVRRQKCHGRNPVPARSF